MDFTHHSSKVSTIDPHAERKRGFTLIELSIVLVIIGLIVGGVLVGQDMIKAAALRATVSQIEKYNTAVNTFYGKYEGLPGDLLSTKAATRGFFTFRDGGGGFGQGDGNGLIQCCIIDGGGQPHDTFGEILVFWRHLSEAKLVDGNFGTALSDTGQIAGTTIGDALTQYMPSAKIGQGNDIVVFSDDQYNYFGIIGVVGLDTAEDTNEYSTVLTPMQARNIDSKIDDGYPLSGTVQIVFGSQNASDTAGGCTLAGPPVTYDTGPLAANTLGCSLRLRFN